MESVEYETRILKRGNNSVYLPFSKIAFVKYGNFKLGDEVIVKVTKKNIVPKKEEVGV